MHDTARIDAEHFFNCYGPFFEGETKVIDIGGRNVCGSLKDVCLPSFQYISVDISEGSGVDVVLKDPYVFPFEDNSVDIVISSSCFEHIEFFWLSYLEIMRVLKPHGLFYLNVPSNGHFHRYPKDYWRFYPDSGEALTNWANRNNMNVGLLESYVGLKVSDIWNDFVAVFIKDKNLLEKYPNRILDSKTNYINGITTDPTNILNFSAAI